MSEWPDAYIQVNDLTIHYSRTGGAGKPPLILLHGVMDNGLCWTPVARDLQQDFDVIMPDARGHGLTGGSLENFSYPQLGADVAALIGVLGLDRPMLFGHSMGALTALMVAAYDPELVRALVMEDPPMVDAPPPRPTSEGGRSAGLEGFQRILEIRNIPPEEHLSIARELNPLWDEAELGPWIDSKLQFNPTVFQHLKLLTPWRELLPRVNCPILLVTGDPQAQALVTPAIAQEAAGLWRQGKVIQIEGAGHNIHRERYKATIPQVQAFLRRA